MKRLFIALKIANTDQINELFNQVEFGLDEERVKWVDKNGLHITLLFLGTTDVSEIVEIKNTLNNIGSQFLPFRINLESLGAFPSMDYPKILWAGVNSESNLFKLQKEILNKLQESNTAENYKYTPHLTIGRIKGGVKNPQRLTKWLQKLNDWQDTEIIITEFVLMESVLSDQGPKYIVLEKFSFGK